MADNYKPIPAGDLPEATSDTVDVLCVENGELKRKPGASIGGGGGGYVITLDPAVDIFDEEAGAYMMSGSYDDFMPILYAGGAVLVNVAKLIEEVPTGAFMYAMMHTVTFVPGMGVQLGIVSPMSLSDSMSMIFANGTWTPPTA